MVNCCGFSCTFEILSYCFVRTLYMLVKVCWFCPLAFLVPSSDSRITLCQEECIPGSSCHTALPLSLPQGQHMTHAWPETSVGNTLESQNKRETGAKEKETSFSHRGYVVLDLWPKLAKILLKPLLEQSLGRQDRRDWALGNPHGFFMMKASGYSIPGLSSFGNQQTPLYVSASLSRTLQLTATIQYHTLKILTFGLSHMQ